MAAHRLHHASLPEVPDGAEEYLPRMIGVLNLRFFDTIKTAWNFALSSQLWNEQETSSWTECGGELDLYKHP